MFYLIVSQIITISCLLYISLYLMRTSEKRFGHYRLILSMASIFYILMLMLYIGSSYVSTSMSITYNYLTEWIRIVAVVLMLSGMGVMIRYSKPKITRAPIALSFLPIVLLFVHPFVINTIFLKELLINFYHGGGLLIALMMFTIRSQGNHGYYTILGGTLVLITAYTLNFYDQITASLIYILISIGVYTVYKGYKSVDQIIKSSQQTTTKDKT